MKPEAQIKALAELDGWKNITIDGHIQWGNEPDFGYQQQLKTYLTSYDAIIPLIQKQSREVRATIGYGSIPSGAISFMSTPSQLCEALLRATGKWTE